VEVVIKKLGADIDILLTINEPGVYAFMSYQAGFWPPQVKSSWQMQRVLWNMACAHRAAYPIIKRHFPALPVGIAQNMTTFEAVHPTSWRERFAAHWMAAVNNFSFYWFSGWKTHDVLGVNYYFHRRLDATDVGGRVFKIHKKQTVQQAIWAGNYFLKALAASFAPSRNTKNPS
jgi:beta-glucosidase/6-phospho-beta-glucosidase/beta-galactosidase